MFIFYGSQHRKQILNLVETKVEYEMEKVILEIKSLKSELNSKYDSLRMMITILTIIVSVSIALGALFQIFK